MVKCKLCGQNFKVISNTHLLSVHNCELKDYIKKYGFQGCGFIVAPNLLPKSDPRYQKWRKSLKKRPAPWNKGFNKETHPSVAKISRTFKEKKIDNFRKWRRRAKKEGIIPASYPPFKKDKNLAFLIGMILGDGNIHKFPRTELLKISLGTDKPLLWKHVDEIVKKVFKKSSHIYKRKDCACIDIRIYQNRISERLEIPLGGRNRANIKIPNWIRDNRKYIIQCLKGLFEAEGSFSIHKKTYTYNFQFSNRNVTLLNEVEEMLTELGFYPERREVAVRLRKKREALAFEKLINFRQYTIH